MLIKLGNKTFQYSLHKKFISSIRLKILSPRQFSVSCPHLTPNQIITKFIQSNSDWILKNALKITPKKKILKLQKITILGQDYQLILIKTQRDSVVIDETDKKIYLNLSIYTQSHAKIILEKRLRLLALKLIKSELEILSSQHHFNYCRVSVKNQSSRFGSCSSRGNLNFNWQIILFPFDKFQHILLHELTHLKIKNHSSVFWQQLAIYDPNSKSNNLWLKKEGTKKFMV